MISGRAHPCRQPRRRPRLEMEREKEMIYFRRETIVTRQFCMKMVRGFTTLQVRLSLNFGCRGTPAFLSLDIRGESKLHFLSGQRISRRAHSEIWTLFLSLSLSCLSVSASDSEMAPMHASTLPLVRSRKTNNFWFPSTSV